jgi:hypothetical protein
MNIDNFVKALQRCKIFLNTNEMELLFNDYDIFENGIVKYQIIINIILEQFWDDEKLSLSEEIYYLLTGNGRRNASLNVLKNYFDQILADSLDKKFFIEFINEYKAINKVNISQTMNLKELVQFLKYYNFGRQSNKYLIDLINIFLALPSLIRLFLILLNLSKLITNSCSQHEIPYNEYPINK